MPQRIVDVSCANDTSGAQASAVARSLAIRFMADPLGLDAARRRATSGGYAAPDAGAVRETGTSMMCEAV
jgi:hypothetical protein